jgi:hypothetical protein
MNIKNQNETWNKIIKSIEQHTNILSEIVVSSGKLEDSIIKEEFERILEEAENRQRQINILEYFQEKIEHLIYQLNLEMIKSEQVDLLQSWKISFDNIVENVLKIDENIINKLENEKEEVAKRIAEIFKAKHAMKGYNLQNVKK